MNNALIRTLAEAEYRAFCQKVIDEKWPVDFPWECPECGGDELRMERDREHVMIGNNLIIACEGYWVLHPVFIGYSMGLKENAQ